MQPADFTKWRESMGYSRSAAAEALGVSRNMPQKYEEGTAEIPLTVALACTALSRQLEPWPHSVRLSSKIQDAIHELVGSSPGAASRKAEAKLSAVLAQVDALEDNRGIPIIGKIGEQKQ